MFCCHRGCTGHDELAATLNVIADRLARIEAAVITEGATVSELDDKLTTIETDLSALDADEQRELADLTALKASQGSLTAEEQARLDALDAKVKAETAAIDAADPAPTPPAAA